jgi:hypothetical protein
LELGRPEVVLIASGGKSVVTISAIENILHLGSSHTTKPGAYLTKAELPNMRAEASQAFG